MSKFLGSLDRISAATSSNTSSLLFPPAEEGRAYKGRTETTPQQCPHVLLEQMTAPNPCPQTPQTTPFNKVYNESCVYTDVTQLTYIYIICTIHTSHGMNIMHTLYSPYTTSCMHHMYCVLVLTWVNRILSNNSEVSCWSLVMSALWCIPNTSGQG